VADLGIVVVNWNVREMVAACLRSVQAELVTSGLKAEIWVVDNASTDGSVEMLRRDFPDIQLIASDKNLGFAAGNNAALRAMNFDRPHNNEADSRPAAVLLLNPDTEIHPGALQTLVDFFNNTPEAGVAGARLLYGDGSFQHSAFDFPGLWQLAIELLPVPGRLVESRLNGRYPRSLYEQGRPFRVGHPLGAAMWVRAEAIEQAGLLDERFHMYAEEVDWCQRMVSAGWAAYCVPTATVTHYGGQSTTQVESQSFVNLWTSRRRFYGKHYGPLKVWLAAQIVRLGMARKASQDREAARRGELTPKTLADRQQYYDRVVKIWLQPQSRPRREGQEEYV
jgi:N-acetylglucosaminyl-diphospho-decaprenol L-rhamnosyltransferase